MCYKLKCNCCSAYQKDITVTFIAKKVYQLGNFFRKAWGRKILEGQKNVLKFNCLRKSPRFFNF